jgi:hypothetical protein
MISGRLILWVAPLVFIMFVQHTHGADKQTCRPALPSEFSTVLSEAYPYHRILALSDLSHDDQEIWEKTYPGVCPGLVFGRFTVSGEQGAILLVPDNVHSIDTKVILIDRRRRSSKPREVFSERRAGNLPVLRRSKPGIYKYVSTGRSVKSMHDVLLVEHLEATVIALVIQGARVQVIRIAD